MPTTATNVVPSKSFTNGYIRLRTTDNLKFFRFDIGVSASKSIVVNWVKLEIGSYATPFSPRLYGEELALCERYYQRIRLATVGHLNFSSSHVAYITLPKRTKMYGTGTASFISNDITVSGTTALGFNSVVAYEDAVLLKFFMSGATFSGIFDYTSATVIVAI